VDTWSNTRSVRWRVPVPGRGHSSPIVWKDHLFITTARDGGSKVSMLAFRRSDGALLWEKDVPTSGVERAYRKNSHASATPVTDGQRVYASFGTHGLAAFDFSGALVWHRKLGDLRNYHGSAGSPVLYKDRIFIYQDHNGSSTLGSFVAAFNARTGDVIWKTDRQESVGWGTPVVVNTGARDELIVNSQYRVYAYDPNSGAELWRVNGTTMEVIPTPVVGQGLVLCSSGRAGPTLAIRPGGKGDVSKSHVTWRVDTGAPYVSSLVHYNGLLYMAGDVGVLSAIDAKTGQRVWQERTSGVFTASPVAADGKIYLTGRSGLVSVVAAGRAYKLLATNEIKDPTDASPALSGGRIYLRGASHLWAIGR
jgi:outer membrane protein assembly factor BamB